MLPDVESLTAESRVGQLVAQLSFSLLENSATRLKEEHMAVASVLSGSLEENLRLGPYAVNEMDVEDLTQTIILALKHFGRAAEGWAGAVPKVRFEFGLARREVTVLVDTHTSDVGRIRRIVNGVLRA